MKRSLCVLLSALFVSFAFFGCTSSDKAPAANSGTGSSSGASTAAPAPAAETVKIRVGIGTTAESSLGQGVTHFGKLLEEKSGGKIKVELCPGSVLGGDRETVEGVGLGTFEMCNIATGPVANFADAFLALDLPYVVTDRETAYKALDGAQGRAVLDTLENSGIYAMSFWELGFRDLYNAKGIVKSPADLKGMKIRVMENDVYISLFNGLGAYATPMSISEVFTSLQQGTIDGHDNPIGVTLAGKFYEADKNCTKSHHVYSATVSMINREFFNSLPAEYQKWIVEADAEARDYERKLVVEDEARCYEEWVKNGGTVTEVDMDEWAKACAFVLDEYADRLNQDFIKALRGE